MKTLYLECSMGAAGDMLAAALLELHLNPKEMIEKLNQAGLPDVVFSAEPSIKCGITGTHLTVLIKGIEEDTAHYHPHESHEHHSLRDIGHIVSHLNIPQPVKENIMSVYQLIAEAESRVHGRPVEQIRPVRKPLQAMLKVKNTADKRGT